MSGTSRPTTASAVNASIPTMCGIQNDAKPSSRAPFALSTIASTGPSAVSPPKSPMRMCRSLRDRRRPLPHDGGAYSAPPSSDCAEAVDRVGHELVEAVVGRDRPVGEQPDRGDDVPVRVVARAARQRVPAIQETVSHPQPEPGGEIHPAVADVDFRGTHAGADPVDDPADVTACPQHVARLVLAVEDRKSVV